MPAGGPEWARRVDRDAKGIPLPDGLYKELKTVSEKAKVDFAI